MKKIVLYLIPFFAILVVLAPISNAQSVNSDTSITKLRPNFFSQGRADSLPITLVQDNNTLPQGKMSLRNDFPYEQAPYQQMDALKYPRVRQEDISYSMRIWEDVDTRRPTNRSMMYAIDEFGSEPLIAIILKSINNNQLTAFNAQDDRFTTPLTPQQVKDAMGNGLDTSATYDLEGNVNGYQVRNKAIGIDSIYTYRLKEDWFYDKNYGKMMVRVIGIAPVIPFALSTGEVIPNSQHPLFWIYFQDLRSILTKYKAYNNTEPGTKIPYDELFDLRCFDGKIIKSDYQNPGEIPWNTLMPSLQEQQKAEEEIRKQISDYGSDDYDMVSQDASPKKSKRKKANN